MLRIMKTNLLIFFCFILSISAHPQSNFCEKWALVNQLINENHYTRQTFNDSLSAATLKGFLKATDNRKEYFLASDEALFNTQKHKFDDYLKANNCAFFSEITNLYRQRLLEVLNMLDNFRNTPLDFSGNDVVTFYPDPDDYGFSKDREDLKNYWRKNVRLYMVQNYLSSADTIAPFQQKATALQQQSIDELTCMVNEKLNPPGGLETFLEDLFLNSFCTAFDPHTNYFNPVDKNFFDTSLTDNPLSLGVYFTKNEYGKITVAYVEPGSRSWREELLAEGDEILALNSNQTFLDAGCLSLENLYQFIFNPEHTDFNLTVKSEKKGEHIVKLSKERIEVSANVIDSYILNGNHKIGFIGLPAFYMGTDGVGCANDVAKELFKLNQERIEALIFDLRGNSGGSMDEASELAGLFIDKGPVAIINTKDNYSITVKDQNPGMAFSKPMIILVNEDSASAAEYFAASLQDHQRALVAGKKTFGKGTAQIVLPLDPENPTMGFVKVTTDAFFRITGQSVQLAGVTPDFEFPSAVESLVLSETVYKNAIANQSIKKNIYFKVPEKKDMGKLKAESESRMSVRTSTQKILALNKEIEGYFKTKRTLPLTLESMKNDRDYYHKLLKRAGEIEEEHSVFTVENNAYKNASLLAGNNAQTLNENKIKALQADPELLEAYSIITDYLKNYPKN